MSPEMLNLVATVIAIVASPLIAIGVTKLLDGRREDHLTRVRIFATLMSNRHDPICHENLQAMHLIDVAFARQREIRRLWREYFEMICNPSFQHELGARAFSSKYRELLFRMAQSIGYRDHVDYMDVERVYTPKGLSDRLLISNEIQLELLRVLRGTGHFQTAARDTQVPQGQDVPEQEDAAITVRKASLATNGRAIAEVS